MRHTEDLLRDLCDRLEFVGAGGWAFPNNPTLELAITQYDFRGRGDKADYAAIRSCMRWIRESCRGKRIGLPKIGAGLAGGDWSTIEAIIQEELAGENVTIVEYKAFHDG